MLNLRHYKGRGLPSVLENKQRIYVTEKGKLLKKTFQNRCVSDNALFSWTSL